MVFSHGIGVRFPLRVTHLGGIMNKEESQLWRNFFFVIGGVMLLAFGFNSLLIMYLVWGLFVIFGEAIFKFIKNIMK